MNKLPTKQIYLLTIIIVGIIALSVYSTYALFTFESSTSDIVSIHVPKSLTISENVYEYQQITVEPNTIATTDIDIYNAFDYEVCYSVWYKIVGETEVQNKVQIFEKTAENLTTSGVLTPTTNLRVTIVIINDNDTEVKVNLGTIGTSKATDGSCSLNLASDKHVISIAYANLDILTTKLLEEVNEPKETIENYLTYKGITETITYKDTHTIYTSNEFTYSNEIFTLTEGEKITLQKLVEKNSLQSDDIYFCKNDVKCSILYKIKISDVIKEEIDKEDSEEKIINYKITKYDKLIGYSEGTNGLRQVNEKDYVYYGDNPNNFIYYNCTNNDSLNTCELWRIVGFFYNEETEEYNTKIVRNNSIGKYQFDYKMTDDENTSSNVWSTSTLHKYLNEEYQLVNNYDIYLDEYTQKVERIPDLEADVKNIKIKDENIDSKINLLNLSDYLYTSSCEKTKINQYTAECLTNNWLNNIEISKEWTLTSKEVVEVIDSTEETETIQENNSTEDNTETSDERENPTEENENTENSETEGNTENPEDTEITEETEEVPEDNYIINYIYSIGANVTESDVNDSLDVRPVVFLKSRMLLLEGNGTLDSPYIVK